MCVLCTNVHYTPACCVLMIRMGLAAGYNNGSHTYTNIQTKRHTANSQQHNSTTAKENENEKNYVHIIVTIYTKFNTIFGFIWARLMVLLWKIKKLNIKWWKSISANIYLFLFKSFSRHFPRSFFVPHFLVCVLWLVCLFFCFVLFSFLVCSFCPYWFISLHFNVLSIFIFIIFYSLLLFYRWRFAIRT